MELAVKNTWIQFGNKTDRVFDSELYAPQLVVREPGLTVGKQI